MGSYSNYIKSSGQSLPSILCVIHQFEVMTENMAELTEKYASLFKDGPKFGINFLITNSLTSGIRLKYLQLFPTKISLKQNDKTEYRFLVDAPKGLIPANYFGRGLIKLENNSLEFQTALISNVDNINNVAKSLAENLKKLNLKKAYKIPCMPNFLTVDNLINTKYDLTQIPVGIARNNLKLCTYDFSKNYTPVLSTSLDKHIHFVYGLIELLKQIPNAKIRIIDVLGLYNNYQGIKVYNEDFDTIIKQVRLETLDDKKIDYTNIFIILGLGAFKNNVPEKTQKTFRFVFEKLNDYKKNKFIVYDDYNSYKSLEVEKWFTSNVDKSSGIWLGDNVQNQLSIKLPNLSLNDKKVTFNQIGYVVKNNNHVIVRYIVDKEFIDEK